MAKNGGTYVTPAFGAFPPFGHPAAAAAIFPSPHQRTHPTGPTYYQPQLVYWPYPSPPVSPTTYYAHPTHQTAATTTTTAQPAAAPHHQYASNLVHQNHHQALFPVDFITTTPASYHPTTHHYHQQQHGGSYNRAQHHYNPHHSHQQSPLSPSIMTNSQTSLPALPSPASIPIPPPPPPPASLVSSQKKQQLQTSKLTGNKQFSDSNLSGNKQSISNYTIQQNSKTVAVVPTSTATPNVQQLTSPTLINGSNMVSAQQANSSTIGAVPVAATSNGIITNGYTTAAPTHILTIDTNNAANLTATPISSEKYSGGQLYHHHIQQPMHGQLAPTQFTGRILSPTFFSTATNYHVAHQHHQSVAATTAATSAFNPNNHYVELYIA